MYVGVEFSDAGEGIAVICNTWLTPLKQQCWWPPHKKLERYNKALKHVEQPSDDWELYNIKKRLFETDDLQKASIKLKKAETTSDVQSEQEATNPKPIKRIRTLPSRYQNYESSDEEQIPSKFPRPAAIKKLIGNQTVGSEVHVVQSPPFTPNSPSMQVDTDNLDLEISTPTTSSRPTILSSSYNNEEEKRFRSKLFTMLHLIKEQNNKIIDWIENQNPSHSTTVEEITTKFPVNFPLADVDSVSILDEYLKNEKHFTNLNNDQVVPTLEHIGILPIIYRGRIDIKHFKKVVYNKCTFIIYPVSSYNSYCITKKKDGNIYLVGKSFSHYESFFDYPLSSEDLCIYAVSNLSPSLEVVCIKDVVAKCILFPFLKKPDFFISYPIIHTILLTLWYLANTETFRQVADRFDISLSSAHRCLVRVVKFIISIKHEYIVWPSINEAKYIAEQFKRKQGIGNIIGAIDGSHIKINKPKFNQDSYINRKGYHSVLLQGVVDHRKMFIDVYCGEPGSLHDARLLRKSPLYARTTDNKNDIFYDMFLLGDSAYPCLNWIVPPFKDNGNLTADQKMFNYKHSSTRMCVENAFGLLKGRFRRLSSFENLDIQLIVQCIMACCVLHNICLKLGNEDDGDVPMDVIKEAEEALKGLVPATSKKLYENEYSKFCKWRSEKSLKIVNEKILLAYFSERSKQGKPSCLWTYYSMLRSMLRVRENLDISRFGKVIAFMKAQNVNYVPKKSKILSVEDTRKFILEASDDFLLCKVVLVFGLYGACRRDELLKLIVDHIEDHEKYALVKLQYTKTHTSRSFLIPDANGSLNPYEIYKKYAKLRPLDVGTRRFFFGIQKRK
ncbi:hypothetical protein PPYR_04139, partial [Photinus pyralis]